MLFCINYTNSIIKKRLKKMATTKNTEKKYIILLNLVKLQSYSSHICL